MRATGGPTRQGQDVSEPTTRLYRFDASGCNGCDVELLELAALAPLGELGVALVERPEEANVLLVTGGSNLKSRRELEAAYRSLQEPRTVVAVGACAATMGVFKGGYAMAGPIDAIVPVDVYILGCPPRPQAILGALAEACDLSVEGLEAMLRTPPGFRGDPHVDQEACMGCGACATVCPAEAIEIVESGAERLVRFRRQDCIYCASCQEVCPSQAVTLRDGEKPWCFTRDASASEARLRRSACRVCGAPLPPEAQLAWALGRVDEKLALGPDDRRALVERLAVCPACRRSRLGEVREAKRLLAGLARRAAG